MHASDLTTPTLLLTILHIPRADPNNEKSLLNSGEK